MRLHPSVLILGLLLLSTSPADAASARRRRNTRNADRGVQTVQPQLPIDPAVKKWVESQYPFPDLPPKRRAIKQEVIAGVLSAIKKDTGADWYAKNFEQYLKGSGVAEKILAAVAENRDPTKLKEAAGNILFDALSQKNPDTGQFLLPMPPGNSELLRGRKIPGRDEAAPPVVEPPKPPPVPAPGGDANLPPPVEVKPPDGQPGWSNDAEMEFAKLLRGSAELREMAAKRLARFIFEDHAGIQFVDAKQVEGEQKLAEWRAGTEKALLPVVAAQPGRIGLLIRFLGVPESERPASAKDPKIAVHLVGAGREQELAKALERWSKDAGATFAYKDGKLELSVKIKPLTTDAPAEWLLAFLKDAYDNAWKLRYGKPLPDAIDDADDNDQAGDVVPGQPGTGPKPGLSGRGFTREELYGKAGDFGVFSVGGRTLSVRVVTEPRSIEDPALVPKVAVYDITAGKPYGKVFPLNTNGKMTLKEGGREYTFGFGTDGRMSLKTGDSAAIPTWGARGKQDMPTVNDLYMERARSARDKGNILTIAGAEYYVWGQGTADGGANVFLPKAAVDSRLREGGDARDMQPAGMAYVNECVDGYDRLLGDSEGRVRILGPDGGEFTAGGKPYHLQWNGSIFVEKKGAGPKPPAPTPTPTPGTGGKPPGNTTTGGATPPGGVTDQPGGGTTTAPDARDADGWPIILDRNTPPQPIPYFRDRAPLAAFPNIDIRKLNAQLVHNGVENAAMFQIDPEKASLPQGQTELPAREYFATIFKDAAAQHNFSSIPWYNNWKKLLGLSIVGSALAVESDVGVVYVDLASALITDSQGGSDSFDTLGYIDKTGAMNNLQSFRASKRRQAGLLVLADALRRTGFDKATEIVGKVSEISERGLAKGNKLGDDVLLVDIPAGAEYVINGTGVKGKPGAIVMSFSGAGLPVLRLYPTFGVDKSPAPAETDANAGGGQGTFAFGSKGTATEDFKIFYEKWDIGADKGVLIPQDKEMANDQPGVRIYRAESQDTGKKVERWYMAFTVEQQGQPILTTQPKLVFQNPKGDAYEPPAGFPENLRRGRLSRPAKAEAIQSSLLTHELLTGYNADNQRGIYIVSDAPPGKDKHCIGVALWWGIPDSELKAAEKAVEDAGCPKQALQSPAK